MEDLINSELVRKIRLFRKERKLSAREFSQSLDINLNSYLCYEKESRKVPVNLLVKMLKVYKCDMNKLLDINEENSRKMKDDYDMLSRASIIMKGDK